MYFHLTIALRFGIIKAYLEMQRNTLPDVRGR